MDGIGRDAKPQFFEGTQRDGDQFPYIWSSRKEFREIDIGKQIFCNRSLNMKNIVAVGFDMDYTLAQYKPETFESLAYEGTVRKLVYDLGYPPEVCLGLCSEIKLKTLSMFLITHLYIYKKAGFHKC